MQLPFTIVVEPPGWAHPRRLGRAWLAGVVVLGLAAGIAVTALTSRGETQETGEPAAATLQVTSEPAGATVEVDGRRLGQTPASLSLEAGDHQVTLQLAAYADASYALHARANQTTALAAELWLRTARVQRLRPTFPGATIVDAAFLADGRLALTLTLPPGDERQLWLLGSDASAHRLGPSGVRGSLALSRDGQKLAYLAQRDAGVAADGRLDEVWIADTSGSSGERRYALPATATDQRLIDLSWAPDGQHLVLVSRGQVTGGAFRTHLLWLDPARGTVRELASLPSEVVASSFAWSPDGQSVAFLTKANSLVSLCLLRLDATEFRYLADIARDDASPIPFVPLSWSPDAERLVYAAPAQDRLAPSAFPFGQKPSPGVFISDASNPEGVRLGQAEGQSPAWRTDGSLVILTRPKGDGPLVLRALDDRGQATDIGQVPVKVGSSYAARWDTAHARAVLAVRNSGELGSPGLEFWLIQFRPEVQQ